MSNPAMLYQILTLVAIVLLVSKMPPSADAQPCTSPYAQYNSLFTTPYDINVSSTTGLATINNGWICASSEANVFRFSASTFWYGVKLILQYSSANANNELYLYDSSALLLRFASQSGVSRQTIALDSLMVNDYFVLVQNGDFLSGSSRYNLTVSRCVSTYGESHATTNNAFQLSTIAANNFTARITNARLCVTNEENWYSVSLQANSNLTAVLSIGDSSDTNIDMYIFNSTGQLIASTDVVVSDTETIWLSNYPAGEYTVMVYLYSTNAYIDTTYSLTVSAIPFPSPTPPASATPSTTAPAPGPATDTKGAVSDATSMAVTTYLAFAILIAVTLFL